METKVQTVAVIDLGSSAVRMVIAQVDEKGQFKYIENVQKPIHFGREVFSSGRLSQEVMNECLEVLVQYHDLCHQYGVARIQAIASSALRDAKNSEIFVDRVYTRTGIDIEIIDGAEENRLELIAVEFALDGKVDIDEGVCLIAEVSSGTTDLIILNEGKVENVRTLSVGAMRLPENLDIFEAEEEELKKAIRRNVREIIKNLSKSTCLEGLKTFVAVGSDIRFVASELQEHPDASFYRLQKKKFSNFINELSKMEDEEIGVKFGLSNQGVQLFYASLLFYYQYMQAVKAEEVIVPKVSIRDGALVELAQTVSGYRRTDVSKQVTNSARALAKKYDYDKPHAANVTSLALKLYDGLKDEHGMGERERLLLEVAGILHDIGIYISPSGHHKHSAYLVESSEIFGLRKLEKTMAANVVRYHRKSKPSALHISYMSLPKFERAKVSKLAAILRIADALDRTHQQKITDFKIEKNSKSFELWVSPKAGDLSPERTALEKKGRFFAELFGKPVLLRQQRAVK